MIVGVRALADQIGASSIHWLFCTEDEEARLVAAGYAARATYQFHWRNRGYADFDGFLAALASRKRKQLRKERARVAAAIDGVVWVPGGALDADALDATDRYYRATVDGNELLISNRVLEVSPDGVHTYGGGYVEYVAQTGREAPGLP